MTHRQTLGTRTEQQACAFLEQQGLQRIQSNYQCRYGEIDLIMKDQACLVFVEVRYRRHSSFGTSFDSVDFRKQQRIIQTAQHYLQHANPHHQGDIRFDVVGNTTLEKLAWIKDAFRVE